MAGDIEMHSRLLGGGVGRSPSLPHCLAVESRPRGRGAPDEGDKDIWLIFRTLSKERWSESGFYQLKGKVVIVRFLTTPFTVGDLVLSR